MMRPKPMANRLLNDDDQGWKYVPDHMLIAVHRCNEQFSMTKVPVARTVIHRTIPKNCKVIRKDWEGKVLEWVGSCGCKRWFGIKDGKINSELRAIILPSSSKDEAANSWENVWVEG